MPGEPALGARFIGRGDAVDSLQRSLTAALAGAGGVTLLIGDAGVGKSTLASELTSSLEARQIRVLTGRASGIEEPPPFALLRDAFESVGDDLFRAFDAEGAAGTDRSLAEFAPQLAAASAANRTGIEQRLLKALDAAEARGGPSRAGMLARIADRFLEFAAQRPTVLVLDDLHRGDESSIAAVEYLARRVRDHPVWILATTRPFESLIGATRVRLERFQKSVRPEEILLPPFAPNDVGVFLRRLDPTRDFSEDEVARRFEQSRGNPALIEQFQRRSAAGLPVHGVRRPGSPPLDPAAERVLSVAAVLGPEFTFDLLLGVTGDDRAHLKKVVDELTGQGVLFERSGGRLEFPEDRLRELAYSRLSEANRRSLHQRAGRVREMAWRRDRSGVFSLARDFYLGGRDEKSIEYNRIAAEISRAAAAPDLAEGFLEHALESQREFDPVDREREAELLLDLARVRYDLGELESAEKLLREYLAREQDDVWFPARLRTTLEIYLIRVLAARGELGAATDLARHVLDASGIAEQPLVELGARGQLALSLYYQGQYREALEQNAEVQRLAEVVGDQRAAARALLWRSGCLAMVGETDESLKEARKVKDAFLRLGTPGDLAQGHLFLGNMLADNRSTPAVRQEALAELQLAIDWGARAQDPRRVSWAHYHSSELLLSERRLDDAVDHARRAREGLHRIGDRVGEAVARKVEGQIAMARGDHAAAESALAEARRLISGSRDTLNEIDIVLRQAQLALAEGKRDQAQQLSHELVGLKLSEARPDLASEFEQLTGQLGAATGATTAG